MMRAIVIEPSKPPEVRDIKMDELRKVIGGYLEFLPFFGGSVYINEDGKSLGLAVNMLATQLYNTMSGRNLWPSDYLRGPMVIFGPNDGEGNDTDASDELIAAVNHTTKRLMGM